MTIQRRASVKPVQLLLDMKVRWGSTHVMIKRAISRRAVRLLYLLLQSIDYLLECRHLRV
jgi:hypothetical protein